MLTIKAPRYGLLVGMILGLVGVVSGCGKGPATAAGSPGGGGPPEMIIPVQVKEVTRGTIQETVELVGTVHSVNRVSLSAEIQGVISNLLKREGEAFKQGEILLELDCRDPQLEVEAAQAELTRAEETLKEMVRGTRREIIEQLEAEQTRREAVLREADLDLQRAKGLFDSKVISQSQLDKSQFSWDQAVAAVEEIKARLKEARNGATAEEIAQAKAAVEARKAALEMARRNLEKTTVFAPFEGEVVGRFVDKGTFVGPGTPLLDVMSTSDLEVRFNIPERLIGRLQTGNTIRLMSDAIPMEALELPITAVVSAADEATRNFPARCHLPPESPFKAGMMVRITAVVGEKQNVLTIPQDALVRSDGDQFVYTVRDNQAAMVPVKVGLVSDRILEITGEIKEGDLVVVVGNEVLFPGVKVQVAQSGPPSGGAP